MLSYSRSSGLFAGVALDGSVLSIDRKANESAYGISGVLASQILEGKVAAPAEAQAFTSLLTRATSAQPANTSPASETAPVPPAAPTTPAPANEPAQTYPMEDPNPGTPPTTG